MSKTIHMITDMEAGRQEGYQEALSEVEKIIDELEPDDMIKKGVTDYGISAKRLKTEIKALKTTRPLQSDKSKVKGKKRIFSPSGRYELHIGGKK